MVSDLKPIGGIGRRRLLQAFGATGASAALGLEFAGPVEAASTERDLLLGGFESGLDGWSTNGGNELERIESDLLDASITQGERALGVGVRGDPHPMVSKQGLNGTDFAGHPFLAADVTAAVYDVDGPVAFEFRYVRSDGRGSGSSGRDSSAGGNRGNPLVVESGPRLVDQFRPGTVYWDMSELDPEQLSNPTRLEVAWYPEAHPPDVGPHGRGPAGSFDFEGFAVFDNIRLAAEPTEMATLALESSLFRQITRRGALERTVTESVDGQTETGHLLFSDGTKVTYRFETVDEDAFLLEFADQTFKLGGGWA